MPELIFGNEENQEEKAREWKGHREKSHAEEGKKVLLYFFFSMPCQGVGSSSLDWDQTGEFPQEA